MTDNNVEFIKENFQKMLVAIGKKLNDEFDIKASQVEKLAPDELKPVVKQGKALFKQMLGQFFNGPQLQSLVGMFNKPFLESMKKHVTNNQEKSLINLVIELFMQIGIPMLQNILGHAKPQVKPTPKKTGTKQTGGGYHPSNVPESSKAAMHHEQVNSINGPGYHRMTSGNRGK